MKLIQDDNRDNWINQKFTTIKSTNIDVDKARECVASAWFKRQRIVQKFSDFN